MRGTQKIENRRAVDRQDPLVALKAGKRRRQSGQRGATSFEFAMVAVITLVIIFGMIDFARALYSYHFVTTAAREAARYVSVRGYLCSPSVTDCGVSIDVDAFAKAIAPQGIDKNQVDATLTSVPNVPPMPVCTPTPNYPGCSFQVTATYNFSWIFPTSFYGLTPVNFRPGTIAMSSTAEMIYSR